MSVRGLWTHQRAIVGVRGCAACFFMLSTERHFPVWSFLLHQLARWYKVSINTWMTASKQNNYCWSLTETELKPLLVPGTTCLRFRFLISHASPLHNDMLSRVFSALAPPLVVPIRWLAGSSSWFGSRSILYCGSMGWTPCVTFVAFCRFWRLVASSRRHASRLVRLLCLAAAATAFAAFTFTARLYPCRVGSVRTSRRDVRRVKCRWLSWKDWYK